MFPVEKMCRALKVSRGGYYAWRERPPSRRVKENKKLLDVIKKIYEDSEQTYGSPRITKSLEDKGYTVSRPRVARLMRKHGIAATCKKKFKVTTDSSHNYPVAPNLLERDFDVESFGEVWVSDITYIYTQKGWLYLTVVIDLCNRQVVGWSMSNSMHASKTTIPALKQAYGLYRPPPGLMFHSDRGIQYACDNFKELLEKYQMKQSMSKKGDCWDNAVAESFFSTLKKERVYRETYRTRWQARQSIFDYIERFYNRVRKHSYVGNKSPVEFLEVKNAA